MSTTPIDFTLPTDEGPAFVFDEGYRARKNPLLCFYRGYW